VKDFFREVDPISLGDFSDVVGDGKRSLLVKMPYGAPLRSRADEIDGARRAPT
jgi:hypothetical protein